MSFKTELCLKVIGEQDDAEALVANDRELAIWWEYSLDVQRSHEMVNALALQLDLNDEELDNLFIEASKL